MDEREHDLLRRVEDGHWWHRVLRHQALRALRTVPCGARVLDAGCGTGGMLRWLTEFDAHGADLSPHAVKLCHGRGLLHVKQASIHDLPFPDGTFDAVLSLDVLYHADVDELRALTEMRRVLKPGGTLVLNLPAFECLRGAHDVAVCGVRRYTACQVRSLLESHSLRIEMIHYWNAWIFLPLLFWRQWSRMKSKKHSDLRLDLGRMNSLLFLTGSIDAWLCRLLSLPFGTSIFAIARHDKPGALHAHE
ncbi:MAG: class I SAM-dependent methyltransferase [Verrucomicrobiaceae bacterium]|nr:class I SAM-dependent methyltransferase [Verrucomicrobiaceae bacterium]